MHRPHGPGVHFPPPFLFVAGFGAGLLLQRAWSLPLISGGRPFPVLPLAWILVALGAGLMGWALFVFLRVRTSVMPNRPAASLVFEGPYRFSRNPMYTGLTGIYLGLALWLAALWPVLLLPVVLLLLWRMVIRKEERYLSEAFGDDYGDYRRRVRRWL
jgi:protein-S-isoprenylcysteine O-methyltransferase Ste14